MIDFWTIVIYIILLILLLIFIALPLNLTARLFDEEESLLKALGTTILLIITFFVCLIFIQVQILNFLIAIFLNLLIIKVTYDTSWGKALVMWIVTIIIAVVILVVVGLLTGYGLLW